MLAALLAAFALLTPVSDILGKLVSTIVGLWNGSNPTNQAQLDTLQEALSQQSTQMAQDTSQILAAISTVDQHAFENVMVSVLADIDASAIAIAEWRPTLDPAQRAQALNTSQHALGTVLEEYENNNYPGLSMLPVLARVIIARLAVLATFPDVRSHGDAVQLQEAGRLLATNTSALDALIVEGNQITKAVSRLWVQEQWQPRLRRPGEWIYTERVTYVDAGTGQTVFNQSVHADNAVDVATAAIPLIAEADGLQTAGIAADRARGQVAAFEEIVASLTQLLQTFPG